MFDVGSGKSWIEKGRADELRLDGTNETAMVTTFGQIYGNACYKSQG